MGRRRTPACWAALGLLLMLPCVALCVLLATEDREALLPVRSDQLWEGRSASLDGTSALRIDLLVVRGGF